MDFIKGIFKSVSWHIGKIIVWGILIAIIGFAMQGCEVNAMTISDSTSTISDTYIDYFKSIYNTSGYKYYVIASTTDTSSAYNRQIYYLCLTNEIYEQSLLNATITCEKQFSYSYNNGYYLSELTDTSIVIDNSLYYTNLGNIDIAFYGYFASIFIVLCIILFLLILSPLFKGKNRGIVYEKIK